MDWQKLESKHSQERREFHEGAAAAWKIMDAEIDAALAPYGKRPVPKEIKDELSSKRHAWIDEWGILGHRHIEMKTRQQKEIDAYFKKDAVKLSLFNFLSFGKKDKERGR